MKTKLNELSRGVCKISSFLSRLISSEEFQVQQLGSLVEENIPINSGKRFTITALPMWILSWHKLIAWSTDRGFSQQEEYGKETAKF